ncbi:hypothetical protein [Novosphingobium sp.]|uniref:hypothetical protein n=1 Tax=Novosphingobium sp. TaxID=1874826 RepID=UPI003BA88C70
MQRSMMFRSAQPAARRRRLVSFALSLGVLALELMLLFWVLFLGAATGGSGGRGVSGNALGLSVIALQSATAAQASHRPAKAKASHTPKPKFITHGPPAAAQPVIAPDPGTLPDQASAQTFEPLSGRHGAGDPCTLAQDLATDLQTNPFAQVAVGSVPEQSLSVAGALLLWDGHWVAPDAADPGSAMLRTIVLREIAAAKPECLAELNPGPQFLFVNGGSKTVTIVIGSGQWRWGDLASSQ